MPTNSKMINYLKDAKAELKKVVWPTRRETVNHTALVIGFCVVVAVFLGFVDYLLNLGLQLVIQK